MRKFEDAGWNSLKELEIRRIDFNEGSEILSMRGRREEVARLTQKQVLLNTAPLNNFDPYHTFWGLCVSLAPFLNSGLLLGRRVLVVGLNFLIR